jgi:sarcosine oxidase subunit alpha
VSHRLPSGGRLIDRARPVRFTYDGAAVTGFAGDTVASALLAAGRGTFTRSL